MDNKIKEAFESIHMSAACQNKIMSNSQRCSNRRPLVRYLSATVVGILILVVLLENPGIAQAVEKTADTVKRNVASLFFPNPTEGGQPDSDTNGEYIVQEQYILEDSAFISEQGTTPDGGNYSAGSYITGSVPEWLELTEDGLFFIGDGQRIEIGSLITEEVPFTYTFTDSHNLNCYIIVGGAYTGGPDLFDGSIGWSFWIQNAAKAKIDPASAWVGGYSTGVYKDGEGRPWYQEGKKILGIPFP